MNWINPDFVTEEHEDDGLIRKVIYLADDERDCLFGHSINVFDDNGGRITLSFPFECAALGHTLLKEGNNLTYLSDTDPVPYETVAVSYKRLGRTFVIGRSHDGRLYVHCRLNNGHGFLAEV